MLFYYFCICDRKDSINLSIRKDFRQITYLDTFIWDDIMDQEYPMKLCIHSKDRIYEGYPQYIEGDQRTPVISLAKFRILSLDNDVLEIGNTNQIIVVDSSKADYIEVTYYKICCYFIKYCVIRKIFIRCIHNFISTIWTFCCIF